MEEVHKKINWHNEVHTYWCQFDIKYEGHQNCSKTLSMHILRVCGHHHMWHQNWHQYVWTSLCQFIFLWASSIVYVFDFLTLDIFLTTWHLFDNLTSFWHFRLKPPQPVTGLFLNPHHMSAKCETSSITVCSVEVSPTLSLSITGSHP